MPPSVRPSGSRATALLPASPLPANPQRAATSGSVRGLRHVRGKAMNRLVPALLLILLAAPAFAQSKANEVTPYYPAPPPDLAPKVEKGAAVDGLTSPLAQDQNKSVTKTAIDSDAEAQMFVGAAKVMWGRYAKAQGQKPGTVTVTKGTVWTVKGRI